MVNKQVTDFRLHLVDNLLKKNDRILEFGPLTRPIVKKEHFPNSYYADIRSAEDIKKLYSDNFYLQSTGIKVDLESIVDIDYVIKGSYKKTFKNVKKFDVAILSHVVEHMPDIVDFFQDILNILKDDGRLILIYPDAEYSFDHFRNGSSFTEAYEVYTKQKSLGGRVMDFAYNVVAENNPFFFWNDVKENAKLPKNSFQDTLAIYHKALTGEYPDDVHFWPFSNHQLIKFFYDMDRASLLKFEIEEFFPTRENTQECMVVLKVNKKHAINHAKYRQLLDATSDSMLKIQYRQMSADYDQMKKDLATALAQKESIEQELQSVYSSKRWQYASKLANVKSKISGKR